MLIVNLRQKSAHDEIRRDAWNVYTTRSSIRQSPYAAAICDLRPAKCNPEHAPPRQVSVGETGRGIFNTMDMVGALLERRLSVTA